MRLVCFILLAAFCGMVRADTLDDSLNELEKLVKAEVSPVSVVQNTIATQNAFDLQNLLVELIQVPENDRKRDTQRQVLAKIVAKSGSPKLEALSRSLLKRLETEAQKQESGALEEMKKTYADALLTMLNAKTAAEVDAPLLAVSRLSTRWATEATSDEKLRTMAYQGRQLAGYLRDWQDCLSTKLRNNSRFSVLQNMLNSADQLAEWLPRSEIATRLDKAYQEENIRRESPNENLAPQADIPEADQEARVKKIVATVHKPADMAAAVKQVKELERQAKHHCNLLIHASGELDQLQDIYLSLQQGTQERIALLRIDSMSRLYKDEVLANLRPMILSYALPRVIGAGEADSLKPGENPHDYLERMAIAARDKSDWELLGRVLDIRQMSLWGTPPLGDRGALGSFLAGANLIRARQYSLAVVSYMAALRSGSQIITTELVGERLDAIKKEHPRDYEEGIQIVEKHASPTATPQNAVTPSPQASPPSTPVPK